MPFHTIDKMPNHLAKAIQKILAAPQNINGAVYEPNIIREVFYKTPALTETDTLTVSWAGWDIHLNVPWNDFTHIRFFSHHYDQVNRGILLLKNTQNTWKKLILDNNQALLLRMKLQVFKGCRIIGTTDLSRDVAQTNFWDNLNVYSRISAGVFYQKQNQATALVLIHQIEKMPTDKPLMVIDLGCGTGQIEKIFRHSPYLADDIKKNIYWVGVDLNEANIKSCQENNNNQKVCYIQADAKKFVQEPLSFLPPSFQVPDLNVIVVASGLLTEQVVSFADAIMVMRALSTHTQVKRIILTGLTCSHISPYVAKQMGYKLLNENIDGADHAIEVYEPLLRNELFNRIRTKMHKNRFLNLSYMSHYPEFLSQITSDEIKNVDYIFMAGLTPDVSEMREICRLMSLNPKLLCWCVSITQSEKDALEEIIQNSPYRFKFISLGFAQDSPIFSPAFFANVSQSFEKVNDIRPSEVLPVHFMRGVTTDAQGTDEYNLFKRILLARLFIALNQDASNDFIAKQFIWHVANQIPIMPEGATCCNDFCLRVQNSNVSGNLKSAAIDVMNLIGIQAYEYTGKTCNLIDLSPATQVRANDLNNEGNGIFTAEEWAAFPQRFPRSPL